MNTKLSAVPDKRMDLTCSACGHEFSYKIADLMLATSDDTTTHEARQRAVCRGCGVRGDNTYKLA
jgi:hypothetical protein